MKRRRPLILDMTDQGKWHALYGRTQPAAQAAKHGVDDMNEATAEVKWNVLHNHGLTTRQMEFVRGTVMSSEVQNDPATDTFTMTVDLGTAGEPLGMVESALVGPVEGDPPVDESEVHYAVRGDRDYESRMVLEPFRPTTIVQVVGQRTPGQFNIYTVYGGQAAPQEPNDPNCIDVEQSKLFWSQHALATGTPKQEEGQA
tara:strand:- start:861 stop:1460 length:600 start_codon:yes stop_codon:yes gene_type:complete